MKKVHRSIFSLINKMKDINFVFLLLLMSLLFIPINIIVFYGMAVVLIFIFAYELYLINTKISELTLSIVELTVQDNTDDILTQEDKKEVSKMMKFIKEEINEKEYEDVNPSIDYSTDYESFIKSEAQEKTNTNEENILD